VSLLSVQRYMNMIQALAVWACPDMVWPGRKRRPKAGKAGETEAEAGRQGRQGRRRISTFRKAFENGSCRGFGRIGKVGRPWQHVYVPVSTLTSQPYFNSVSQPLRRLARKSTTGLYYRQLWSALDMERLRKV